MSTARTALQETGTAGEFKRKESAFRNVIQKGGEFEPESTFAFHCYVQTAEISGA